MFRMWGRAFHNGHMIRDCVAEDSTDDTRTHKVFRCLEKICAEMDLQVPIWLGKNIREFQRISKTRFSQDNFIETVPFDYLEISIIEE